MRIKPADVFNGVKEVGLAVEDDDEFELPTSGAGGGVEERDGPVLGRNPGLTMSGLRSLGAGGGIEECEK